MFISAVSISFYVNSVLNRNILFKNKLFLLNK
jgi:hypothetical protein